MDGAVNADLFAAYVGQQPVPSLRPGDEVVDDLSGDNRARVRQAIGGGEPPAVVPRQYSPGCIPVELVPGNAATPTQTTAMTLHQARDQHADPLEGVRNHVPKVRVLGLSEKPHAAVPRSEGTGRRV
ncbi:MAG TPA: hypothetical protein VFW33_21820 [Gemmataceae bacterium]|nr:hypothetical protein [Gemmataceae bacterium]